MTCFFTPGPSELHPEIATFLDDALKQNIGSISHRSRAFEEIYRTAAEGLRELMGIPVSHQIFFLGSATEAMERIIQGCAEKATFHLINGAFSQRFFLISEELGKDAYGLENELGAGFDLKSVEVAPEAELICATQNETSTGVALAEAGLNTLKLRFPEKLLAVDVVSSAPYCRLDFQYVDAAFFSVQKLFALPAGLGVLVVNAKCIDRAALLVGQGISVGSYHSLLSLKEYADTWQTPETPNVLAIYLLGRVVKSFLALGVEKLRRQIDEHAERIYSFLESSEILRPGVPNAEDRSRTVITAELTSGDPAALRRWIGTRGFEIGAGYGELKGRQVRIANFPVHSSKNLEELLAHVAQWRPGV